MSIVPPGGLVLVTGANSYLGSTLVKILLDHGYKVRGTVRSVAKHNWMLSYFGPNFSLYEVPEMSTDNAFDGAVEGVDGIAHNASRVEFSPDVSTIEEAVKGAINILEAAAKEPKVKRVVLTSSSAACLTQNPGEPYKITQETFNTPLLEEVKKPWNGENEVMRGVQIYSASKTKAEMESFEWVRKNKPHFVFNSVVPNTNFGSVVAPEKLGFGSSAGFLVSLLRGRSIAPKVIRHAWFVDALDSGLLHLGALTLEEVKNERLLAFAEKFTWSAILEILQRRFPDQKAIPKTLEVFPPDMGEVDNKRSIEVLRMLGRDGFISLEDSVVDTAKAFIAVASVPDMGKSWADRMIDSLAASAETSQA